MLMTAVPDTITIDWTHFWTQMGWVDIVFFIFIFVGIFMGVRKGLAGVLPNLLEVILAQVLVVEYGLPLAASASSRFQIPLAGAHIVIVATIAVVTIVLIRFLFKLFILIATLEFKPPLSQLGGAVIGALKFALLLSLIVEFLTLLPLPFLLEAFAKSISGPYLMQASEQMHFFFERWIPGAFQVQ